MATVDRKTLYVQIWTIPAIQLALKYGISDVGLAKVCRRHKIPRPPRGYWARIRSGQRIKRPPLPNVDDRLQEIDIHGANMPFDASDDIASSDRSPRERIKVEEVLTEPHPLVGAAYQQLQSAKPGPDKVAKTDPATAVDVRVRPETVDRAARIFDTFAKIWEQEGGRISLGTFKEVPCTVAAIGKDAVAIHMTETTEPLRRGRRPADAPAPAPFPRLCFVIGEGRLDGIKPVWADTTTIRLEKMLRPLIDAIRRYVQSQRQARLDAECRQRQRDKAHAVRQAKADEHSEDFYLRQQLLQDADRWHQAQKIRDYIAAMEVRLQAGEVTPTDPERFRAWLDWAKWFADDMDPMVQATPRQRQPITAKNTPVSELDLTSQARNLVGRLEVKDSDELLLVTEAKVRELIGWDCSDMWREITRLLEGLGYDVRKRKSPCY